MTALDTLSTVLGWGYFCAWSISFWPQAILNYRRGSVTGLSFEFLAYNITGFIFYTLYSTIKYFVPNGCGQTVEINDLAFGYHAVTLTAITILQCVWYRAKSQRVHPIHAFIVVTLWIITIYTLILCFVVNIPLIPACHSQMDTQGQPEIVEDTTFTLIDLMGYIKAGISIIKYTPQVYLNWSRQSTVGWSIANILLDFTGGSLSFAQQGLDAYNEGSMSPITGNIPKLLLAIESMIFDIIFMIQHFILYRGQKPITQEGEEEEDNEEKHEQQADNDNDRRKKYEGEEDDDGQVEGRRSRLLAAASAADNKRNVSRKSSPSPLLGNGVVANNSNNIRAGEEDFYYQLPSHRVSDVFDSDGVMEPGAAPAYYNQQRATPSVSSSSLAAPSSASASLLPPLPRYTIQQPTPQRENSNDSLLYRPPSATLLNTNNNNPSRSPSPFYGSQWNNNTGTPAVERR